MKNCRKNRTSVDFFGLLESIRRTNDYTHEKWRRVLACSEEGYNAYLRQLRQVSIIEVFRVCEEFDLDVNALGKGMVSSRKWDTNNYCV